jgi:uncharacterized protein (TIGR03437 family)
MRIHVPLALLITVSTLLAQAPAIPITGLEVPALTPYESALRPIMQKWSIPGAALAITDSGRLIYARGFGYADREGGIPVQPGSSFRLASISKTLTGMTILKLAEEGRLSLDAKFMDLIPNITPIPGFNFDARMRNVTVRQLLQHTGGFDKDVPDDWVLQFGAAARALNVPYSSLNPDLLCRYAISQQLDFDPGTRYSYNQSGYLFLGRIIEKITGKKYEDAVREKLLTPAGAARLKLGHSLLSQKEPDEVKYYDYPDAPPITTAIVPGAVAPAPRQYGAYWVEQAEAYGGWIGNTIDLMKYINALEGRRGPAILNPASLAAIIARPAPPVTPTGPYVGLTWRITPITGGQHWWHSGGATGTRNLLARRQNNRNWVVLMNSRPEDEDTIITEIFNAFAAAETQVTSWPTNDLFPGFDGVVNAATLQPGIAPGSWVAIKGANFGASTRVWRGDEIVDGKLPTELDGVSVKINGKPAAVYFISPEQINVQAPSDDREGDVQVEVTVNGVKREGKTARLQRLSPGFFLWAGKYVVATDLNYDWRVKAGTFPGANTTPAKPGEVLVLWGTGFGPTSPAIPGGQVVDVANSLTEAVRVTIGGLATEYLGGALSPGAAGLYQIAVRVPAEAPDGDLPIMVDVGGIRSPDWAVITVQR